MSTVRASTLVCQINAITRFAVDSTEHQDVDLLTIYAVLDQAKQRVKHEIRWRNLAKASA
jgi:hypothetical protein